MIDLNDALTQQYFAECREHLVTLESDLLTIEELGSEIDEEVINRAFRAVHSVKGGAGFFDLTKIPKLAHQLEDVLGLVRSGKMMPTPERIRVLLAAADTLHELIRDPLNSDQADTTEASAPLARLYAEHKVPIVAPGVQKAGTGTSQPETKPIRILVAEDDFTSRLLLQTFLSRYGECHLAVNGKEAVDAFRASLKTGKLYDLICMDIMMPEMDGQTAVKQIRALEEAAGTLSTNGARIIMTTALDDAKNIVQSFKSLCDAYLLKPIDTAKLLGYVQDLHLGEPS